MPHYIAPLGTAQKRKPHPIAQQRKNPPNQMSTQLTGQDRQHSTKGSSPIESDNQKSLTK